MSKQTQNQPSATAIKFANTIVQQLDVLNSKREQWEANAFKKANDELYDLLADCLAIYLDKFENGSLSDKKAFRLEVAQRLKADGIRVVKTSTTLTMLARYVFKSDRKRAQGYGYVIAAAVSHGIGAKDFPNWVRNAGGIEEIKRLMVTKPETIAKREAVATATDDIKGAMELAAVQPLAHVDIDGLGTGEFVILLAKPNPNGGSDVVATLTEVNDALVKALVQRMAKQQVEAAAADAALEQQVKAGAASDVLAAAANEQQAELKKAA
jgi:hypothetical protein